MGYYATPDAILFIKGSVTCHENAVKDSNCPKDQYMHSDQEYILPWIV